MPDTRLPQEDQLVTLVSVRDGNIYVSSAHALVCKESTIALRLDHSLSQPPSFERAQPVTLLYSANERVLRLKAVVRDQLDQERITVTPVGDVKEGDRRDYRRTDVELLLGATSLGTTDPQTALAQMQDCGDVDADSLSEQTVNLSGSGSQFTHSSGFDSDELIDLKIILPLPTPRTVSILGAVVRSVPNEGNDGHAVAARFQEISEKDQDLVVYTVFSKHFASQSDILELDAPV